MWAVLAPLAALLAMPGLFTVSKLFFVRDLASSFLPHHLWFRHTVLSGQLPFWNPYPGCGYATLSDPVFQTFFPPTLPLRFLPATLGFNLIVALPFVVAALGAFRFLRRHVSLQAASLGAVVFCVSGPMLSTASTPNLSWSCACIPWILSASDRLAREATLRRVASLAAAFGVMLLAGEPVIFAATVALTAAYALVAGPIPPGGRRKATTFICTIAAMALGAALAAVQFFPTAMVTSRSIRAAGMLRDMWSLHPARVIEILSPFFFGKFVGMPHEITQWLFGLNDGREPLLVSLYLGAPVLLLAALGALSGRRNRWTLFWCGVAIAALIAAFGSHTPVYPALQRVLPALKLLRFPSKLFEISTLAIAILAALGWDALSRVPRPPRRLALVPIGAAVCLAVVGASVLLVIPAAEGRALDVAQQLGTRLGLPNPSAAAHSLLHACLAAAPRLLVLSLATGLGLLLATSARREGSIARGALFVLVCADLVLTNAPINPTIDASLLSPFDWTQITRSHATDRIFVSRNFVDAHQTMDDAAAAAEFPPDTPPVAYRAAYDAALENNLTLSSAGTTLSRELTGLRPREYFSLLQRFSASDRAMRYRFLSWAGTRYYLVTVAPPLAAKKIRELKALGSLAIYESAPAGGRVFIASSAVVEPNVERQIERLFQPDFPLASTILVESEPPSAAASAGPVGAPRAAIVDETATSIRVEATAAEGGGYLVLLDSFDPSWRAWVDDRSAPLVRADGVFRAVRVPAGRHTVRFAFRPNAFHIGAAISFVTGALLAAAAVWRR
jgi:hypothetical protein